MSKPAELKLCSTCRFWTEPQLGEEKGTCNYFPASIDKSADDWCGQWKLILRTRIRKD
jgi:hypothetical protein